MRALGSRPTSTFSERLIAPAILLLAAVLAYQNSFSVPFFFDDGAAITQNPSIRDLRQIGTVLAPPADGSGMTGRPIVNLSLAINYALGENDVRGYHVFNLLVHGLSALVLFGVLWRTFARPVLLGHVGVSPRSLAFIVTLLWTVHPLQTEAVTCVIQRTELLFTLAYLTTLYAVLRSLQSPRRRAWELVAIAACALGMASKEVMVSAPLIVLLYDRTFLAGTFRAAWQQRRGLYLGLASTWLILAALLVKMGGTRGDAAGFGLGVTWWSYALKQCEAIVTYLALSVWPHPLVIDYGTHVITDPLSVVPHAVLLLALVAVTFITLRSRPVVGFGLFFFFAVLAPSSSVVPLVSQTMAEHRMYLPLAAVLALVAAGGRRVLGSRVVVAGVLGAAAMGLTTAARNQTMQDEVTLWADTIAKAPANARAHGSLGLALAERGQARDALPHFQRALELDPASVATEQNIGNAHYRLAEYPAALAHYRKAVQLDPRFASGYNSIGAALHELGDPEGALTNYQRALELVPDHYGAHQNAARALFGLGRFAAAVVHYEQVLRLRPTSPEAHYDLGLALARAGDIDRATQHFSAALRLRPSAISYLNFARFLINAGRTPEAMIQLETALRLQPDLIEARRELDRLRNAAP